jgi:vesicle-fusing ATPase
MQQIFSREIPVPAVNTMDELRSVLRADSAFGYEALQDQCLNELIDTTGTDKVGVGIKRVLEAVREASLEVNNVTSRFAEIVAQQMISIQTG